MPDKLIKLGTFKLPLAISKTTPPPALIIEPASGVIFKTTPVLEFESTGTILVINKPAADRALRASSRLSPTIVVGTVVSPGPSEIVNVMLLPYGARDAARGS